MYKIQKYNILFDFPIVLELLGLSRPYQGAVWTLTNNPLHDFFFSRVSLKVQKYLLGVK